MLKFPNTTNINMLNELSENIPIPYLYERLKPRTISL